MNAGLVIGTIALVCPTLALFNGLVVAPLVIVAGLAAAGLTRLRRGFWPPLSTIPFLLLALLFVWAAVSLAWTTEPPLDALWRLARVALMCASGLLLVASVDCLPQDELRTLRRLVPAGVALALGVMAVETTFGAPLQRLLMGPLPTYWPLVLDHFDRGLVVSIVLLGPAVVLLGHKRRLAALALIVLAVALVPRFVYSAALAALAIGIAGAGAILLAPRRGPVLVAVFAVAAVLLAPLAARLGPTPADMAIAQPGLVASGEHRLIIWRFVADHIAERPMFGWGFDSSRSIPGGKTEFAPTAALLPLHPHNAGLQWWLELGMPGALLGAVLLAWSATRLQAPAAAPIAVAASSGTFLSAFTFAELSFGIWQGWWLATLWLAAGLTIAAARTVKLDAEEGERQTRPAHDRFRLLYFVTEDWYFWSHRLSIATAAQEAGCEVIVVTRANEYAASLRARGFRVINIHLRRGRMVSLFEIVTLVQVICIYLRERPDAVHHVGLKPCLYGGFAARLARTNGRIYALAGLGYIFITGRLPVRFVRRMITAALRQLLRHANSWLILQNRDDRDMFLRSGVAVEMRTVMVRGSGVDANVFRPSPLPQGPVIAAQVSRMLRDKGIVDVVAAARDLHLRGVRVQIKLVGDVDPHNPSSISERQLRRWTDEHLVEWTGFRSDIVELWRSTHIAILASYREGMPRSLLEAGASGRAIVATDVPGNRELVIDGETGLLVPPGQPKALAAAIERLARDPALCERLGTALRQRVEREFADPHVVEATLSLYRRVAGTNWPRRDTLNDGIGTCAE